MEVLGKRVPYKCVNGDTSEGSWVMYSGLRLFPLEGGISMWRRDSYLRGRLLGIQVWV